MSKDVFDSVEVDDLPYSNKFYILAIYMSGEWAVFIRVGNVSHYADPITDLNEVPNSVRSILAMKRDKLLEDFKRLHPNKGRSSS